MQNSGHLSADRWSHALRSDQFPLAPMGVLAPRLRTLDGPLVPPSTLAEIFRHPCLQSSLHSSPPVLQKSFPMFQTPTTTPCRFSPKLGPTSAFLGGYGASGVPKWFGGLIYTFDGKKKPPVKCQNSSLPPSKIGKKYPKNLNFWKFSDNPYLVWGAIAPSPSK